MSLENWGQMTKAQDDPQTINEAIDAAILAHEEDPESHMGAGESIENHRINEVIDHPAGSVPVDKFANARFITTAFESLTGWVDYSTGTGYIESQLGSANLRTGDTSGGLAAMNVVPDGFIGFNVSKAFFWRANLKLSHNTSQVAHFGLGYMIDGADYNGFGFKITNGTLIAFMGDYTNLATVTISDIDITLAHLYEIRYSVVPQKAEFYIDGILVATFDTGNFPENEDPYVNFMIENTANSLRVMYVTDFMYQQER
jgi:hypothetical protein